MLGKIKKAIHLERQSDKKVRAPDRMVLSTWSETPLIGCISFAESLAGVRRFYVMGSLPLMFITHTVKCLGFKSLQLTWQQSTRNFKLYLSRALTKYDFLDNLTYIMYMLDYLKQVN